MVSGGNDQSDRIFAENRTEATGRGTFHIILGQLRDLPSVRTKNRKRKVESRLHLAVGFRLSAFGKTETAMDRQEVGAIAALFDSSTVPPCLLILRGGTAAAGSIPLWRVPQ